jgi:hypothetical protein
MIISSLSIIKLLSFTGIMSALVPGVSLLGAPLQKEGVDERNKSNRIKISD